MLVSAAPMRGVHRRLSFPPPHPRPSLAIWKGLGDLDVDIAFALFMIVRRVESAAESPRECRWQWEPEVRRAAASAPEIGRQLLVLGTGDYVRERRQRDVIRACRTICRWATERGFFELAIQLAESIVRIRPDNGRSNFEAARLHRCSGSYAEAELLYARAIRLAREHGRWSVYVRAHLGIGHVHKVWGDHIRARAHFEAAAGAAWHKAGEKWLAAQTQHDLMLQSIEMHEYERAFDYAARASVWIPRHHIRFPALVHDFALLLQRTGSHELALPLLTAVVGKKLPVTDQILGWSTLARTAAELGHHDRFQEAEERISMMITEESLRSSAACMNLACGALALGMSGAARLHATECLRIATSKDERMIVDDARELLSRLQGTGSIKLTYEPKHPQHAEALARDLTKRLHEWRGPTWRRKKQFGPRHIGQV
jgi:tetratricopeptide (TPR) repeat protein